MEDPILQRIVEALLFVSHRPLGAAEIAEVLKEKKPDISPADVQDILRSLSADYANQCRSFQLCEVASGYQLKTLPEFAPFIARLLKEEMRDRLSMPALETLAIIAYKQPVTRAEVEAVRGVNIDGVIATLMEKDLIRIVGKKDVPGKPFLFGTSRQFLLHFGLKDLKDLPNSTEFKEALRAREEQLEEVRVAAESRTARNAAATLPGQDDERA